MKVLILAYDFPPYHSVAAVRPGYWYRHMEESGIEPVVITRQWSEITGSPLDYIRPGESDEAIVERTEYGIVIKAPYRQSISNKLLLRFGPNRFRLVRKISTGFPEVMQYFLPVGTKRSIYKSARKFLKQEKVDFIIPSGDPFVLFHYAGKLSKEFGIPWIADYRDPWSQDYLQKSDTSRFLLEKLEKRILRSASHFITVFETIRIGIESLTKIPGTVIANGFNEESVLAAKDVPLSNVLTFFYAGTLVGWQPLELLLKGFEDWKRSAENIDFRIIFYGLNDVKRLKEAIEHFPNLKENISYTPRLNNSDLMLKMAEGHIAINFNDYAIIGTKIYDYIGARKLILFCFENEPQARELKQMHYFMEELTDAAYPQAELIRSTNSGIIVQSAEDLVSVFEKLYSEFLATGKIACDSIDPDRFSRKNQTKKLAELLHDLKKGK